MSDRLDRGRALAAVSARRRSDKGCGASSGGSRSPAGARRSHRGRAIQGFGAVGGNGARFLVERGAVVASVSERGGSVSNPDGLDVADLVAWRSAGKTLGSYSGGENGLSDTPLWADCDIVVPAARGDVITTAGAGRVEGRAWCSKERTSQSLQKRRRSCTTVACSVSRTGSPTLEA